jgi:hypothetical protein
MVFFEICLFDCFACFPLAPGREKRVFVSLKRAQLIFIYFFKKNLYFGRTGPRRAGLRLLGPGLGP